MSELKLIRHPRRWWLREATSIDRPLIIALHGFLQSVGPPRWWRPNNFVQKSQLLELADQADVSVCFPSGGWARNWNWRDIDDLTQILLSSDNLTQPSRRYIWGFSDGATLAVPLADHINSINESFISATIAHSGLHPSSYYGDSTPHSIEVGDTPVLLVCGSQDRTPVYNQQQQVYDYHNENRNCEIIWAEGIGHQWATELNSKFLYWSSQ